jgi:alkaline phosphatase D
VRRSLLLPLVLLVLGIGATVQLSGRSGDAASTCSTTPDVLTHGPRLGEVTGTSIRIWARACVQATVAVEYKETGQDWSQAQQTAGVLTETAKDNTVTLQVTGLTAGISYDYRLRVDGQLPAKPFGGSFSTLPSSGPITFIISSDMHHPFQGIPPDTSNVPDQILQLMSTKDADFSFMMGDQIVIEIVLNNLGRCCVPESQADYELAYRNLSAYQYFGNFAANTPLMTTWDDHEIVNDFSASSNQTYYSWARAAYDEFFGNLNSTPLSAGGIQYIYDAGDMEFFVMDTRSYRSANFAPDGPDKTMLGAEQKQALKDWFLNSDAIFKLVISSVMVNDYSGHTVYGESWPAFATERNEILDFITDNDVSGVLFFSGDEHTGRVVDMAPWDLYEFAPNPLGTKIGSPIENPDSQVKFQSNFVRLFGLFTADTSTCPATLNAQLIDEDDVVRYDMTLTEGDLHSDRDSDGLIACSETQGGTDPDNPDTDGDHCGDGAELGPNHTSGGERNPLDQWDYMNPSGDGTNRIDDIIQVVQQYFKDLGNPQYLEATDRTAGPLAAGWRTGPPDGRQRVDDILSALRSYYNDCTYVS